MKYVLSPERIREAEKTTIEEIGISEEALIEKAAGEIVKCIGDFYPSAVKILVVAGGGNNGADGLSAARMLIYKGYLVDVLLHFSKQSPANLFLLNGLRAAGRLSKGKVTFVDAISKDYDLIIDSLFGIGLNRELSKDDTDFIKRINSLNIPIISADIPSGLNASTGLPMPVCINSDTTICFGAYKTGMFNGQGPNYYKRLLQGDIELWYEEKASDSKMLEKEDILNILSDSIATAHKGTYGKALIIAGSKEIYGAAYLCAKAAFYSGAGMVKVITHACNRSDFLQNLPEAMYRFYESPEDLNETDADISWADTITVGPGLGTKESGLCLINKLLNSEKTDGKTLIFDADALNLLAENPLLFQRVADKSSKCRGIIFTPHKKELERLYRGIGISSPDEFYDKYGIVLVEKDAKTKIYGDSIYINNTGNDGMATAGSGDVLSGILSGLSYRLKIKDNPSLLAAASVFLHGFAGDIAANEKGKISMSAVDILESIPKIWKNMIS